jgi:hypothetical protein
MFGDFANHFGLNQFLQSMKDAQQQPQLPFAPGQVDAQGGMFARLGAAPGGSLQELGFGGGDSAGPRAGGAPTGSAVAQGPALAATGAAGGSPLQAGGASPMAPGGPQALEGGGKGPLEQGADDAFKSAGGEMNDLRNSIFKAFGINR